MWNVTSPKKREKEIGGNNVCVCVCVEFDTQSLTTQYNHIREASPI
jgi:hypothetical protein